jgi:hypothetical protein
MDRRVESLLAGCKKKTMLGGIRCFAASFAKLHRQCGLPNRYPNRAPHSVCSAGAHAGEKSGFDAVDADDGDDSLCFCLIDSLSEALINDRLRQSAFDDPGSPARF